MILLNGSNLTLEMLIAVARHNKKVDIDEQSKLAVQKASDFVKNLINEGRPVYGINTGFGDLSQVEIKNHRLEELQENLIKSHACGMGNPLDIEIVRAMLVLRINALIKGHSGTRLETIQLMLDLLNAKITPVVFEQGSLGASGDLALLSHMSLPLLGLGEVFYEGERCQADIALKKANLKPLSHLAPKEGLSLINGTQAMSAIGAFVLYDAFRLMKYANLSLSMTMEALEGVIDAFAEQIQTVRGHIGQLETAVQVKNYLKNSSNITKQGEKRVQDAYSIRCAPQVHGASLDAFYYVHQVLDTEMNAVTDNPILFVDEHQAISAGNFHGQPLALAFDYLSLAIAELANISERRIERLVNPKLNQGLPPFLSEDSGVNSGFMIVQYTAASIVSENKVLAHPASVDSIPSSANQEDHVSMGAYAVRKAKQILDNVWKVIALEIFTAYQALHFRGKDQLGEKTKQLFALLETDIPFIAQDEIMSPYMQKIEEFLKTDAFYQSLFKGDEVDV
ncbi:MAG: histidine ammonia-lyase [Acholeplasmataceae bacterium]|nr:histidine ammonia-lyase [Acholeplasmataceae bacterium]